MAKLPFKDRITTIAAAIREVFRFGREAIDPKEQALRRHNWEYRIAKKANIYAYRAFKYYSLYENEKDFRRRHRYKAKFKSYKSAFMELMVRE